jgi:hypothetical protein
MLTSGLWLTKSSLIVIDFTLRSERLDQATTPAHEAMKKESTGRKTTLTISSECKSMAERDVAQDADRRGHHAHLGQSCRAPSEDRTGLAC